MAPRWVVTTVVVGLITGAELPPAYADVTTRTSDVVLPPEMGWQEAGFRLQLRLGAEWLQGLAGAPQSWGVPLAIEPGLQLDAHWSVFATFHYAILLPRSLSGLRYAFLLGGAWHPWNGLVLSLAAGYTGQLTTWKSTSNVGLPSSGSCTGNGGAVQARLAYLFIVGETFSTGPTVQGEISGLQCGGSVGWWQAVGTGAWAFAWR